MVRFKSERCFLGCKKKIAQYQKDFKVSQREKNIAAIRFFFHENMGDASEFEIAKALIQLKYCADKKYF